MLYLAVRSRVSDGGPVDSNAVVVAKLEELFPSEGRAIVGDYGVWDPKFIYDVEEEFHCVFGSYSCYGFSFDPFVEFVDHHQKVGVAPVSDPCRPTRANRHGSLGVTRVVRVSL